MEFVKSIFINCPFDKKFVEDLLKPILYVTIKNGFTPRLALEISDSGESRLEKIIGLIKSCQYSIHDLSIIKSESAEAYARMNMPFELGIDYGFRKSGTLLFETKRFLILSYSRYDYMKALSDINGFDIKAHNNDAQQLMTCLYTWFSETVKVKGQDPPAKVFLDFVDFNRNLFRKRSDELQSVRFAIDLMENMTIPEYIEEIKSRF